MEVIVDMNAPSQNAPEAGTSTLDYLGLTSRSVSASEPSTGT
jgi:hypothetical protein